MLLDWPLAFTSDLKASLGCSARTGAVTKGVPKMKKHWLLASLMAILLGGCSTGLKEYQQLTMEATLPNAEAADGKTASEGSKQLDYLAETEAVLVRRLDGFGIESAEVTSTSDPDQVIVRLPVDVDVETAKTVLTRRGQLYLRNEKPENEEELAGLIEELQRLLVEQNTLRQTEKANEAAVLTAEIEKKRNAIANLFEPSKLTGDRLESAKAVQEEGDIWAVLIQFDEKGSEMFAEQTKEMAGTGRAIGLFLDNVLLSTPIVDVDFVETGITGGEALIAGNFTEEGAKDLEIQLNSGALPVYLKTVAVTASSEVAEKNDDSPKAADDNGDVEETATEEKNSE